ncbi:uncharacterized protein METZ01_LOCUS307607 [marine metagenome]|uniref:Uncharacterized protein n=1 Tax=marine metagenome TaxID=408172 RepID=A0A382N0I9_9ZZZZ
MILGKISIPNDDEPFRHEETSLVFPNGGCFKLNGDGDDGKKLKKRVSYRPMGLGKERNAQFSECFSTPSKQQ